MNKPVRILLLVASLAVGGESFAQSGGNNTFEFLNLVAPARIAALGGNAIATHSDDITLVSQNPALLSSGNGSAGFIELCGIYCGNQIRQCNAGKSFNKTGNFAFNLQ
ncbi:MAG: hypothetical protein IPP46_15480 [Bacteroidetes bacterium]|nr:hypothetical protein [Bacteroidota bacterium]